MKIYRKPEIEISFVATETGFAGSVENEYMNAVHDGFMIDDYTE